MFYNEGLVDKYLDVLDMEIDKFYMGEEAQTIYIGGGTPSSLSIHQLERLFTILKKINQNKLKEFTIEVNPEDIDEDKLKLFKKYGVNRISIGHQTKFQKYQDELGRNSSITKEKIGLVKKYFSNISIDLMYGFHDQTEEELKEDIKYILSLDVSHISCYSLILEEHTKLLFKSMKD